MRIRCVIAATALIAIGSTGCGIDLDNAEKSATGSIAFEGGGANDTSKSVTTSGGVRGVVKWFNDAKGSGSSTPTAKTSSCTSPPSRATASAA